MTNPYSAFTTSPIPSSSLFIGKLARSVYLTSALPHNSGYLSGHCLESLVVDSIPNATLAPGNSSLDVLVGSGANLLGLQIKSMKKVKTSVVWRRFAIDNKSERIPASRVSVSMATEIGTELLDLFQQGFYEEDLQSFLYLQAMHDGPSLKLLYGQIDRIELDNMLSEGISWSWSKGRKGSYPVLEGYHNGTLLFSWAGLSGNHFHIRNMPYFLSKVASSAIMYTTPLRQEPLTLDQLETAITPLLT